MASASKPQLETKATLRVFRKLSLFSVVVQYLGGLKVNRWDNKVIFSHPKKVEGYLGLRV